MQKFFLRIKIHDWNFDVFVTCNLSSDLFLSAGWYTNLIDWDIECVPSSSFHVDEKTLQ